MLIKFLPHVGVSFHYFTLATFERIGQCLPLGACGNTALGKADRFIVNPPTF